MRMKIYLTMAIGLCLSVSSAIASTIESNMILTEQAKVVQLQVPTPELTNHTVDIAVVAKTTLNQIADISIYDYGGAAQQVNSNKLAYRESNVLTVNFAKVQNTNFERMRLTA